MEYEERVCSSRRESVVPGGGVQCPDVPVLHMAYTEYLFHSLSIYKHLVKIQQKE